MLIILAILPLISLILSRYRLLLLIIIISLSTLSISTSLILCRLTALLFKSRKCPTTSRIFSFFNTGHCLYFRTISSCYLLPLNLLLLASLLQLLLLIFIYHFFMSLSIILLFLWFLTIHHNIEQMVHFILHEKFNSAVFTLQNFFNMFGFIIGLMIQIMLLLCKEIQFIMHNIIIFC